MPISNFWSVGESVVNKFTGSFINKKCTPKINYLFYFIGIFFIIIRTIYNFVNKIIYYQQNTIGDIIVYSITLMVRIINEIKMKINFKNIRIKLKN